MCHPAAMTFVLTPPAFTINAQAAGIPAVMSEARMGGHGAPIEGGASAAIAALFPP
jgi:hypothetical protein